eukprot:gene36856-biopygen31021
MAVDPCQFGKGHFDASGTSVLLFKSSESEGGLNNVLETDMRPGDIRLWSQGEVEESAEEEGTPMPVAFGPVLAFMETTYEDARKEYL